MTAIPVVCLHGPHHTLNPAPRFRAWDDRGNSLPAEISQLNDVRNSGCPRDCSRTARRSRWLRGGPGGHRRGLTALFWPNINPYGTFGLGRDKRLGLVLPGSVPHPAPRHPGGHR
ncbi:hypothetical protein ABZS96_40535 [Streptomyces avermitilis]|uniref:hypothetical protein n=1 Tax=Streptomyces avermitilis TaxID=33903 RepID=UPI0033B6F5A7